MNAWSSFFYVYRGLTGIEKYSTLYVGKEVVIKNQDTLKNTNIEDLKMYKIKKYQLIEAPDTLDRLALDISRALLKNGRQMTARNIILAAYLLYKVKEDNSLDREYKNLANGEIPMPDEIKTAVKETVTKALWGDLINIMETNKYTLEDCFATVFSDEIISKEDKYEPMKETPKSLIDLGLKILDIKPKDKVVDVCSGVGSFLIDGAALNPDCQYLGYEININAVAISIMRADLMGTNIKINHKDALTLIEEKNRPAANKYFSNYPLVGKMRSLNMTEKQKEHMLEKYDGMRKGTSSEWIFNGLLSELIPEEGKAVAIMSKGSTWNSVDRPMRKYFVEKGLIECIISLPEKMFPGTMIETSMIVISNNNSKNIRIIDATNTCQKGRRFNEFSKEDIEKIYKATKEDSEHSKVIDYQLLKENDYTLNMTRYLKDEITFENPVPFKTVIKEIRRGAPIKASELDKLSTAEETDIQYLMLSNIKDGQIDENLPYLKNIDEKYEKYTLRHNDFILSRNNSPYKVAVAQVKNNTKIIAGGNLYMITLDEEKVDPYYIMAFFNSPLGDTVLGSISVGSVITNLSIRDISNLNIPLPPMAEQKKIAEKYYDKMIEIKNIRKKLEQAQKEIKEIFPHLTPFA